MDVTWIVKYITEFLGTAILIILRGTERLPMWIKGERKSSKWLVSHRSWLRYGVMIPALMFGNVSGNHVILLLHWDLRLVAISRLGASRTLHCAQLLGAMFRSSSSSNQSRPYYLQTTNPNAILGSFSTIVNTDDGCKQSHAASMINGLSMNLLDRLCCSLRQW